MRKTCFSFLTFFSNCALSEYIVCVFNMLGMFIFEAYKTAKICWIFNYCYAQLPIIFFINHYVQEEWSISENVEFKYNR